MGSSTATSPNMSTTDQVLVSLVVAHLISLPGSKASGAQLKHACPFHADNHPSASTNMNNGLGNCKACGETWNARKIAQQLNIQVPKSTNGRTKQPPITLADLATDKGLPADFLASEFGLIDLQGGGVGIPYKGIAGQQIETKKRTALVAKNGSYWPKGKDLALYGQERLAAWKACPRRLLVEGESDTWTGWYHQQPTLGIPGANAAKVLEKQHVDGVDTIYAVKEPDTGGPAFEDGTAARLEGLGWTGQLFIVTLPNGMKDLNELHKLEPNKFNDVLEDALKAAKPRSIAPNQKVDVFASVSPRTLIDVVTLHQKWLYMPDPGWLIVALAGVVANKAPGDPVWLLGVAPPGYGKTENLNGIMAHPDVYPVSTLTEAALLSGVPKKDQTSDSKGGLLREMGAFGILLLKDFGSIMSQNRDNQATVLAALREIYDGSWDRHVGADGGRSMHWEGKAGLIGASTPAIDAAYSIMAKLGERFALYRLSELDDAGKRAQAQKALAHAGKETEMRRELSEAVLGLFKGVTIPTTAPQLSDSEREWLITLATLTTRCRSAVERNPYKPDLIENIPGAEAPTRLVVMLSLLLAGLRAIGAPEAEQYRLVAKVALDSMSKNRHNALHTLAKKNQPVPTSEIALAMSYPTQTARRTLEDLACYGVVTRISQGPGQADLWDLAPEIKTMLVGAGTFPGIPVSVNTDPASVFNLISISNITCTGISGTVNGCSANTQPDTGDPPLEVWPDDIPDGEELEADE